MNQSTTSTIQMLKENKIVPKLRFPEFRDAGEWDEKQLKQICEVNPSVKNLPQSFVYIDLESVEAGVLLRKRIITIDSAPSRAQRLLKNGDIIFQMVRPYQKNNYFFRQLDKLDYVASTGYAQLRAHQSSMYLFQYLHHQCFVDKVLAKCTGSSYPAINSGDLSEILVVMPDILEQQKIADCLSSLDELISAQSQKLETLKTHKKGLMQQLFPTEGETVPKLRFPEFRNTGEWEKHTLGNICISLSSGKGKSDDNGIYNLYGSTGIIGKTSSYTYDGNFILVARVGANAGLLNKVSEKFEATDNTLVIILKKTEKLDFIYYSLERLGLNKLVFGSGQPLITGKQLKDLDINLPLPSEQKKIASCLSSIDDLITVQSQKLDTLKVHKKGLMQQLFPGTED
jgi:type I restriction enzyme S subunit